MAHQVLEDEGVGGFYKGIPCSLGEDIPNKRCIFLVCLGSSHGGLVVGMGDEWVDDVDRVSPLRAGKR